MRPEKKVPLGTRLILSACAGCVASTLCHPLDVARVQMQTNNVGNNGPKYSGSIDAAAKIFRRGGIPALWAGLSAAYLRQFSYSAVRMGLFSYLLDHAQRRQSHGHSVSFGKKLFLGSVSGFVGSIIGNPAELAIVRMANDSKLPPGQRRNYKSSLHACARIIRKEGFAGLGRGVINSSIRASVLNAFQFGTYSQAKDFFVQRWPYVFTSQTSIPTMFIGSMCSAFFAVGASMPLDVVKSRLMSIKIRKGQKPIYTGMIDCFRKSYQAEGLLVFWRGFLPGYIKLAPYTVIAFIALEKLTQFTGNGSCL